MADNVTADSGTGGAVFATDDVSSVHYPISKITIGAMDSAGTLLTGGNGTADAGCLRVTVASDSTGVLSIDDNGGSLTVDGTVTANLSATDNAVLDTIDAVLDVINAKLVTGTVIGDVNLGATDNAVLDAIAASVAGTLTVDLGANNDVTVTSGTITANLGATDNAVLDAIAASVAGTLTVGSHAVTNAGTFATQATCTNAGTFAVQAACTNAGTFAVQVDGTALTALQLIDNPIVAHDAAVSGSTGISVIGFEARSTEPTAVASADATRGIATLLGKQVTQPYCIPASNWSYAAASGGITDTTGVTAKAAAGVGIRNYITRAQVVNGHATVSTDIQILDGASGTVLWRGFAQAAGGGVTCVFDPPLRGSDNTLVEIACGTTGSATYFNLQGYSAAE